MPVRPLRQKMDPRAYDQPNFMGEIVVGPTQPRIVTPSQFTEASVRIIDPVSNRYINFAFLPDRRYLLPLYNSPCRRLLLYCARQVEKSTTLCNVGLAHCCTKIGYTIIYVSPSTTQTKEFSETRLKETMSMSPLINALAPPKLQDSVFKKKYTTRSQFILRYAFLKPDRVRGISGQYLIIDEVQDILSENLPVIFHCVSHFPEVNVIRLAGTPKTLDNPIHTYWEKRSTQNEWVIPCEHCGPGKRWNVMGMSNIGQNGPVCSVCKKPIRPDHPDACWVSMAAPTETSFDGYRIPQLMVPWIWKSPAVWRKEIVAKLNDRPALFYNEVLAQSYDSGIRPITREELVRCCDRSGKMDLSVTSLQMIKEKLAGQPCWMGIDWSGGSDRSYTVLHLATYIDGLFTVFYSYRFEGAEAEPAPALERITNLIHVLKPLRIGVDFGGGLWPNNHLLRMFGPQRIILFQYAGTAKKKIELAGGLSAPRWMVSRHLVMADIFTALKDGKIKLPSWQQWEHPFGKDVLNIHCEYDERRHQDVYNKRADDTDDSFHALVFLFLASHLDRERWDIISPHRADQQRSMVVTLEDDSAFDDYLIEEDERNKGAEYLIKEQDPWRSPASD